MNKSIFVRKASFTASAACGYSAGKIRENNEDNFFFHGKYLSRDNQDSGILTGNQILDKPAIYAVFDGMGGEAYGEVASYIATQTLDRFAKKSKKRPINLLDMCEEANLKVCSFAQQTGEGIVGSTAAILQIYKQTAEIVNIGDSKVFLLRDGKLIQVSEDHTDKKIIATQGINRKPRLTQHLGIPPVEMRLVPHKVDLEIREGDRFLLCSDGLTDMVSEEKIKSILDSDESMKSMVERLINLAIDNGGRDNITVICCAIMRSYNEGI